MIEIKARFNPISYEKPYYKRQVFIFSLWLPKKIYKIFPEVFSLRFTDFYQMIKSF